MVQVYIFGGRSVEKTHSAACVRGTEILRIKYEYQVSFSFIHVPEQSSFSFFYITTTTALV